MKKLSIWALEVFFLILSTASISLAQESIEDLELELFKDAVNGEEIQKWSDSIQQLKIQKKACDIQISSRILPLSCYRALHLQVKLNEMVKNRWGGQKLIESRKWAGFFLQESDRLRIDRACLSVVREIKELELKKEDELLMSRSCWFQAREKIKINRYKAGLD